MASRHPELSRRRIPACSIVHHMVLRHIGHVPDRRTGCMLRRTGSSIMRRMLTNRGPTLLAVRRPLKRRWPGSYCSWRVLARLRRLKRSGPLSQNTDGHDRTTWARVRFFMNRLRRFHGSLVNIILHNLFPDGRCPKGSAPDGCAIFHRRPSRNRLQFDYVSSRRRRT